MLEGNVSFATVGACASCGAAHKAGSKSLSAEPNDFFYVPPPAPGAKTRKKDACVPLPALPLPRAVVPRLCAIA